MPLVHSPSKNNNFKGFDKEGNPIEYEDNAFGGIPQDFTIFDNQLPPAMQTSTTVTGTTPKTTTTPSIVDNQVLRQQSFNQQTGNTNFGNQILSVTLEQLLAGFARTAQQNMQVTTIKRKLPPFNKARPDLWFIMVEAEFNTSNIQDDQVKYLNVIRALEPDIIEQLADVIRHEPTADKCKTIKNAILSRLSDSRQNQFKKLFKELTLYGKKPSQLLRKMRELADGGIDNKVLQQMWLDRLPAQIRPHLITTDKLGLDTVAEFTDRFVDVLGTNPQVAATSARPFSQSNTSNCEARFVELQQSLATCVKEIYDLKLQQQNIQQQLQQVALQSQQQLQLINNQNQGHRSRNRSATPTRNGICYYHLKFGAEARKCTLPCKLSVTLKPANQPEN